MRGAHFIEVQTLTALAEQARAAEFNRVTFAVILAPDGMKIRGRKKVPHGREYRFGDIVPWDQIERRGSAILFDRLNAVIDHFTPKEAQR